MELDTGAGISDFISDFIDFSDLKDEEFTLHIRLSEGQFIYIWFEFNTERQTISFWRGGGWEISKTIPTQQNLLKKILQGERWGMEKKIGKCFTAFFLPSFF